MKSLIIGGSGFVGKYLAKAILDTNNNELFLTKLPIESFECKGITVIDLDINNPNKVDEVLNTIKPDFIYHLAALSSVAFSWQHPQLTVDVNVKGIINLLESTKKYCPKSKLLVVGSAEEYGTIKEEDCPVKESYVIEPQNIYSMTKAAQETICKIYVKAYGIHIVMVRAFNHIGPGQTEQFVVSDFSKHIAMIEKGISEPVISVGNLEAQRDFSDVRDIVSAYLLLIENGTSGEVYNVGSGRPIKIKEILSTLLELSEVDIDVIVDEDKIRPIDVPIIYADTTKLKKTTGWITKYDINDTLLNVLEYWRRKI